MGDVTCDPPPSGKLKDKKKKNKDSTLKRPVETWQIVSGIANGSFYNWEKLAKSVESCCIYNHAFLGERETESEMDYSIGVRFLNDDGRMLSSKVYQYLTTLAFSFGDVAVVEVYGRLKLVKVVDITPPKAPCKLKRVKAKLYFKGL